jgi:predicted ABC-type ATPase
LSNKTPSVIVLAGPNGAGKTTAAPALLKGRLGVTEFVNADVIARGLAGFDPDKAAIPAGKIMLARLRELARQRASFAFETTLASRSFAPWMAQLVQRGYEFHLVFLWLPNADLAVARIADRVRLGGHGVPETTVRRRYTAGLRNFFHLYRPLAATWQMYDNALRRNPTLIALGRGATIDLVGDAAVWNKLLAEYGYGV